MTTKSRASPDAKVAANDGAVCGGVHSQIGALGFIQCLFEGFLSGCQHTFALLGRFGGMRIHRLVRCFLREIVDVWSAPCGGAHQCSTGLVFAGCDERRGDEGE